MEEQKTNIKTKSVLLSYLWLAIGIILLIFSNGRWIIPLATWLAPIFFIRFLRTNRAAPGIIIGMLAYIGVVIFTWRGLIPMPSMVMYLSIASGIGLILFLPFIADRLIAPRLRGFTATLVFPLAWTTVEYINSILSPYGTWGSIAYTQYGNLPLIQIISVTGIWGLCFLMTWFASVVNWAWEQDFGLLKARRGLGIYAGILALVLLFGGARLALLPPQSDTVRVAALATPHSVDEELQKIEDWSLETELELTAGLPDDYLARSRQVAQDGAKVVLWSEGTVKLMKEDEAEFIAEGCELARQENIYLGMALKLHPSDFPEHSFENKLVWIDPSGNAVSEYYKTTSLPGENQVPGDGKIPVLDTPYGRLASVICMDMDYPGLIRQAGKGRADLMLVPSNDWKDIDPLHTHMAVLRALENGFSMIRVTGRGLSIAVDYQGRVQAAKDYFTTGDEAMITDIPTKGASTLYSKIGDLFAWLSAAGFLFVIGIAVVRRKTR